ncbi:hypothetical protein LEN26_015763 [Aphanomyces euteiches]|nr:hypothetical protein LEN26_015763 [Aphanomyces euteiches]
MTRGIHSVVWLFLVVSCALIVSADKSSSYKVVQTIMEGSTRLNVVRTDVKFDTGTVSLLFLLSDLSIIGGQFNDDRFKEQAIFPGFAIMQASRYLDRPLKRAMQIGLGVGTVPTFLRQKGIPTDVVEISEGVVTLAQAHFDYDLCHSKCKNGKTVIMDGLKYLQTMAPVQPSYDLIIIDVYTGYNVVPFYTDETLWLIKESWLTQHGVLVVNFVGYYNGPHMDLIRALYVTLRSVFQYVRCFREMADNNREEAANIVFYTSSTPITFKLPKGGMYDNPEGYYGVIAHFEDWEMFKTNAPENIEVAVEQSEYAAGVDFDDLKDVMAPHLVLKKASDFQKYHETLVATENYMRYHCIQQFPAQMWRDIGFEVEAPLEQAVA